MLRAWRHPRPEGVEGLCVGAGTNAPVHWRRAKRLARRIQAQARHERLPHVLACSPLRRCADVGRWLRRWGWHLEILPALAELSFGTWEGRRWETIPQAEVDAWVADFEHHAPGGGESLRQLLTRIAAFLEGGTDAHIVLTHGGWISAAQWLLGPDARAGKAPQAALWPRALGYSRSALLKRP